MPHGFTTIYCSRCGHEHPIPVRCDDRFCPVCSQDRRHRIQQRLAYIIQAAAPKPGERLKHIVLTLRSEPDPGAMLKRLVTAFKRLRTRAFWRNHVSGGAYFLEFTYSNDLYHVHMHIIAYTTFMPQKLLSRQWAALTGSQVVWISETKKAIAIRYLTLYTTKQPPDASRSYEVNKALRSQRLFQCFGQWTLIKVPRMTSTFPCPECGCTSWIPEAEIHYAMNSP